MNPSANILTPNLRRQYLQIFLGKGMIAANEWLEQNQPLVIGECTIMTHDQIDKIVQFFEENPQINERDYLTVEEKQGLSDICK